MGLEMCGESSETGLRYTLYEENPLPIGRKSPTHRTSQTSNRFEKKGIHHFLVVRELTRENSPICGFASVVIDLGRIRCPCSQCSLFAFHTGVPHPMSDARRAFDRFEKSGGGWLPLLTLVATGILLTVLVITAIANIPGA